MAIICRDYKLLFIMVPITGCTAIGKVLKEKFGGEYLPQQNIVRDNKQIFGMKHNTIAQLREYNLISEEELNSYLKFATVRNPFDRYASRYQKLVGSAVESQVDVSNPNNWYHHIHEGDREKLRKKKLRDVEQARAEGFETWLLKEIGYSRSTKQALKDAINTLLKGEKHITQKKKDRLYPCIEGVDEVIRFEYLERDLNNVLSKAGIKEAISIPVTNKTPGKKSYQDYYSAELRTIFENFFAQPLQEYGYEF